MDDSEYPALFRSADQASNARQGLYLSLLKAEYGLLFVAAVLSMNVFSGATFYAAYAFVFVLLIVVLLTRSAAKPEQDWYKCRALAESTKTLTWRYVMRAEPFEEQGQAQLPKTEFRDHLYKLFTANRAAAEKIDPDWSADDQITAGMEARRDRSFEERKIMYMTDRVQDQRHWYVKKAKFNRDAARKWVAVGVVAYLTAMALAISRIRFPDWQGWPIEPVIVFATSVIGWVQIKKFNELSAAYTITAQEIGMIKPTLEAAASERDLSDAVNEAELAFSREHTLWIARQTN